jgi:hypothetical protein
MFLNSRTAKTVALSSAVLLLPAAVHAEEHTVERGGVTYVYTVKTEKNRTVITGTADRLTPFRLVVRGERVKGEFNHRQVDFSVRDMPRGAEVAVR